MGTVMFLVLSVVLVALITKLVWAAEREQSRWARELREPDDSSQDEESAHPSDDGDDHK